MMVVAIEFVIRAATTAVVVVGITLLVQHLGARLGGIVVGLPIVFGPAMYFLLVQHGPTFVSETAVSALTALGASVGFAWAFARAAVRRSAWVSLAMAAGLWLAAVVVLGNLPESLHLGLAIFGAAVVATHLAGHDPATDRAVPAAARRLADLVLRGLTAGIVVGIVSLAAPRLGPALSGIVLAFPVTLAVLGVTLHQRHGGPTAASTIATTQFSMTSIAAFIAALVVLLEHFPAQSAFWIAIVVSLVPTAVLTISGFPHRFTSRGATDDR